MTDPTPIRAEVEALVAHNKALIDRNVALRERAEAAERELARVRQLAWDAQGKADRDASLLAAARRAEDSAWETVVGLTRWSPKGLPKNRGGVCMGVGKKGDWISRKEVLASLARLRLTTEGEA